VTLLDPWVSAKTVHRAYREMQKRTLARDNRPIKERYLKFLRFVTQRLEPDGLLEEGKVNVPPGEDWERWMTQDELLAYGCYEKRPKGKDLVREWNRIYPKWRYQTSTGDLDTNRFWRDYNQTRARVARSVDRFPQAL
jgi:hypothetical protein